jgi:hypothetical protein
VERDLAGLSLSREGGTRRVMSVSGEWGILVAEERKFEELKRHGP